MLAVYGGLSLDSFQDGSKFLYTIRVELSPVKTESEIFVEQVDLKKLQKGKHTTSTLCFSKSRSNNSRLFSGMGS
jgi:hypothetical protein